MRSLTCLLTLACLLVMPVVANNAVAKAASPTKQSQRDLYRVTYKHTVRNSSNATLTNVAVFLPIPQSCDYQRIESYEVEPRQFSSKGKEVVDEYGNSIMQVVIPSIPARSEFSLGFSCTFRLDPQPKVKLNPRQAKSLDTIPDDIQKLYLADDEPLGLKTDVVRRSADQLLKQYPNPVDRVIAIHGIVAKNLRYVLDDNWDPAPVVMQRKTGSCSEFSYVFCALCRATGIPTRFVAGTVCDLKAKRSHTDRIYHRWPEAFLPPFGWVPFDPTLDRGRRPKSMFVGAHFPRVLILTRSGGKSRYLGRSYLGANTHWKQVKRDRVFLWSWGTAGRIAGRT